MQQLMFEEAGSYAWRESPDPQITAPEQALVRPLVVACCDLDVAVAAGPAADAARSCRGPRGAWARSSRSGTACGACEVGDRVVVPFQISCGECRACRRGVTGSCGVAAVDGDVRDGAACGPGRRRLHGRSGARCRIADAMLVPMPDGVDPIAIASMSDNIPDGWRAVGPTATELAALDPVDRRVLVVGRLSIGLYAAALRGGARGSCRLRRHRPDIDWRSPRSWAPRCTIGEKPDKSLEPYPVTVHTSADPSVLAATLRVTWPDGVCTDTGIYAQGAVEMPLLPMYTRGVRFVTGRVNARRSSPRVIELLAGHGSFAGRRPGGGVGGRAVGMADDDGQDGVHRPRWRCSDSGIRQHAELTQHRGGILVDNLLLGVHKTVGAEAREHQAQLAFDAAAVDRRNAERNSPSWVPVIRTAPWTHIRSSAENRSRTWRWTSGTPMKNPCIASRMASRPRAATPVATWRCTPSSENR